MTNYIRVFALAILSLLSANVLATNGYFSHGFGTANKALAGAGTALPQEAMIVANNPAGLVHVGTRFDIGAALFTPERGFADIDPDNFTVFPTTAAGQEVESNKEWFLIPGMALSYQLDDKNALGFAMYGNGGMNSTYRGKDTGNTGIFGTTNNNKDTGVDMMQLFMNFSYARKINESLSLGASALYVFQRFSARGFDVFNPFRQYDNPLDDNEGISNQGNDYGHGFGVKAGLIYKFNEKFSIAASYQPEVRMTKFQRYKYLFAEEGGFNVPATATIGTAIKFNSRSSVVFDVQRIWYADIVSVGNPMTLLNTCDSSPGRINCLGGSNGAGFGWRDMTIYKLGYQHNWSKDLILRAGYSYGEQPIPRDSVMFNIVAPAVLEEHFTVGFTQKMSKDTDLNFEMMYAPNNPVIGGAGPNGALLGGFTFADQYSGVELFMDQFEIEMSYSWKF